MTPSDVDLAVAFARVEGKLDVTLARTAQLEERYAELDVRLRGTATEDELRTVEDRLRAQETRQVVTPKSLTAALSIMLAALAAVIPLMDRLYGM